MLFLCKNLKSFKYHLCRLYTYYNKYLSYSHFYYIYLFDMMLQEKHLSIGCDIRMYSHETLLYTFECINIIYTYVCHMGKKMNASEISLL